MVVVKSCSHKCDKAECKPWNIDAGSDRQRKLEGRDLWRMGVDSAKPECRTCLCPFVLKFVLS